MPITITFYYDENIQRITGKPSEPAVVNEDMPFIFILYTIFKSYPEIERCYPPGMLGFAVNGKPPREFDVMLHGDVILLFVT